MLSWARAITYPNIDPVFLRLGPLQFRWYGLMYLIGLTLAYFIIGARARAQKLPMNKDQVYDMIVYAAVGVFAGGRLGYVLFYNLSYYLENPLKIFAVWEGGMSFHGGLIGTIVALVLFAKRQGITVLTIADLAAGVTPVGLGLGRIGNFINGELYGRPTDVDWCMVFPAGGPACRHPSQLYEALLEGLLLFTVLWLTLGLSSAQRDRPGTGLKRTPASPHDRQDDGSCHNHRYAQQLTHRNRAEDKADLRIGLSEKLHDHPAKTVAYEKGTEDGAGRWEASSDEP